MSSTLSTTTQAIRVARTGGPEVLALAEVPLAPPAAGEIRIRHSAIGVNYIDVYFRTGLYPPPELPFVPGMEGAGSVEAVGEGVKDFKPGDRVVYATRPLGSYAVSRNLPAERALKLPVGIDERTAAGVMLKGMTAQYLVRRAFKVEKGHTVLVHAAAGGVGLLLVQWAKHLGARVIGSVSSAAKGEAARAAGCDFVLVSAREDFVERVAEITERCGCQVVYDSIGKDTFARSLECLAVRGMLVSYGQSSGAVPPFDLALLAKSSGYLTRPGLFHYTASKAELHESAWEVFEMLGMEKLAVTIGGTYPLADAKRAHADLEARKTSGSLLLIP